MMGTQAATSTTPAAKHKVGRPRTKTPTTFTAEQLQQIDEMAEAQCKDTLIAERLGWDYDTFKDQFSVRTRQKRAEGKARILEAQYKGAQARGKGAVTERIWWGKQHLEQTDRQDLTSGGRELAPVVHLTLTEEPGAAPIPAPKESASA